MIIKNVLFICLYMCYKVYNFFKWIELDKVYSYSWSSIFSFPRKYRRRIPVWTGSLLACNQSRFSLSYTSFHN